MLIKMYSTKFSVDWESCKISANKMASKLPNNLTFELKLLNTLIYTLIFLINFPQQSLQQEIISKSTTVQATCNYRLDLQNRYSCFFDNLTTFQTDILEIVGIHLPGRTDADVLAVYHDVSRINRFNGEVLRKFVNLRLINLRSTNLQSISPNAFVVCANLEEFNIEINGVSAFHSQMFQNCGNLRRLLAFSNRIQSIPDNLFGSTRNLEIFDLHRNSVLFFVPGNLFQNMTNLRIFNVGSNQLVELSPNLFVNVAALEEVNIAWNRIRDAQSVMNLLNGQIGLRRIMLDTNSFPMFSLSFFAQFQRLEELTVGGLQNSTGIAWQSLPSTLTSLRAYSIGEEIPENAFNRLTSLTILDISGSGITVLQKDTFKELRNLERLFVMETGIRTIHAELFISQGNLRVLYLAINQIEEIPDGVFAPLVNLGLHDGLWGLHLFSNKIQRLSANIFGQHPNLDYIDFSFNQIMEIDRGIFSRFAPVIAYIGFHFNNCTQSAFWNATNLEESEELQWCFNNFEGITTTTPGGCGNNFKRIEIFVIIFVGFVKVLMNFIN